LSVTTMDTSVMEQPEKVEQLLFAIGLRWGST
jgi:hypothetical protein